MINNLPNDKKVIQIAWASACVTSRQEKSEACGWQKSGQFMLDNWQKDFLSGNHFPHGPILIGWCVGDPRWQSTWERIKKWVLKIIKQSGPQNNFLTQAPHFFETFFSSFLFLTNLLHSFLFFFFEIIFPRKIHKHIYLKKSYV
jgi:hypothetical protein